MSNLAEVHDLQPHIEARERRVAEIEDGFTRIANELLEAVLLAGLTQHQLLVFMAVMRKTYGFNKKVDWISNEQLSKLTGMLPHKCSAAKSALVKRKILSQNGRLTGINKAIGDWEKAGNPNQVNLPESGKECLPESGNRSYPNQVTTKDNITKDKKDNKNTLSEQVQTKCEKSSQPANKNQETDQAFESIFWCAGMRKGGKKSAASAFRTQFKEWRSVTKGTAEQFAVMLAEDIAARIAGCQFGFDRLLPATYLNGQRWQDDKPSAAQPVSGAHRSPVTASKSGYVFIDR
ncbi:replication protein [Pantoea eucrina]|uniref:replication protein n=1 Tax=Pantoea eucrina TaxID=472693 RepID=UPI000D4EB5F9|nr:replication protein [Pantoea eucrina]PPS58841.1 replication protein [Pantoea sp. BRM17]UBB12381.1 replication protein [Pantoea eucrina]